MTTPPATGRTQLADVLLAIDRAIEGGEARYVLPDFLAAVDWSAQHAPATEAAKLLGRLELWDSEFREGDLTWPEFAERLAKAAREERERGGSAAAS
jgi:hypothetical protein